MKGATFELFLTLMKVLPDELGWNAVKDILGSNLDLDSAQTIWVQNLGMKYEQHNEIMQV